MNNKLDPDTYIEKTTGKLVPRVLNSIHDCVTTLTEKTLLKTYGFLHRKDPVSGECLEDVIKPGLKGIQLATFILSPDIIDLWSKTLGIISYGFNHVETNKKSVELNATMKTVDDFHTLAERIATVILFVHAPVIGAISVTALATRESIEALDRWAERHAAKQLGLTSPHVELEG